jgi:hypothetical protein
MGVFCDWYVGLKSLSGKGLLHMGVVKTLLCNAVGCPDDCGEQLLATENSQPVTTPFHR